MAVEQNNTVKKVALSNDETAAALRMVWPMVQARLDADGERYTAVSVANSAKRRYAGYVGK